MAVGLLLTIISAIVLIYFVHHITEAVHVDNIIATIGSELEQGIDRLFLEPSKKDSAVKNRRSVTEVPTDFETAANRVLSKKSGYLQQIDVEKLKAIAHDHDLVIKIVQRPGQFIVERSLIAYVASKRPLSFSITEQVCQAYTLGKQRRPTYDVEFSVDQIVEIAIRALSSVSDPNTAIRCIDRLSVSLCHLLHKFSQDSYLFDPSGALR